MKIREVVDALERFAPLPLQEDFDNAGLQVGLTEADMSGALLCLEVTEAVVDEAIALGCNLIVAHHPLIFHRLSHIGDSTFVERCVMKAIQAGVTIVAMHTNMDNARGGVNFKIAEKMELDDVDFFVRKEGMPVECGSGVMGTLRKPMCSCEFFEMLKLRFGVECIMANEPLERNIHKVAICGGAGAFLLDDAIRAGADAFVTGEMHYHEFFDHEQQIQIAVIGHYESEQFTSEVFRDIIEGECPGAKCYISRTYTNPIHYV